MVSQCGGRWQVHHRRHLLADWYDSYMYMYIMILCTGIHVHVHEQCTLCVLVRMYMNNIHIRVLMFNSNQIW